MRRLVLALTLAVPLAAGPPAAADPPDFFDCGADTRDWMDGEVDIDFSSPPPEELRPLLVAAGCDPNGKPTYRGIFDPNAGEPDRETQPADSKASSEATTERKKRQKPKKRDGKRRKPRKNRRRG